MADLSVMSFLNEETQQEAEYNLKDAQARQDIVTINGKIGSANGIAELDANGRVPSSQLPSYVDDVLEYASQSAFPATGETGKIYIALDTNKTFRWSGSAYVEISESLALGETSSTAYAGNKGKANADAIAAMKDGSSIDSFGDVETALAGKVDKVTGKGLSTNDYDNTAKGIVDNIQSNVIANTKLIKDTVGWSGKNLLPAKIDEIKSINTNGTWSGNTYEYNGITYTVLTNADGYVTEINTDGTTSALSYLILRGYANYSGNLIYNGCTGGSSTTYELMLMSQTSGDLHAYDGDAIVRPSSDKVYQARVTIKSGVVLSNKKFYPMLRDANILDDTYEPYRGTTAFPRDEQAVLGAKNRVPFPYYEGMSKTANGVTFTVDENGVIDVDTNGQASTAIASFAVMTTKARYNDGYLLSGKSQYANADTKLQYYDETAGYGFDATEDGVLIQNSNGHNCRLVILVPSGKTISHAKFYPMFRLATDPDDTYVPYAMTNKELTEKVNKNTLPTTMEDLLANVPKVSDSVTCLLGSATHIMQTLTGGTYDKSGKITLICTASGKYEWWGIIGAGEYFAYGKIDTTTTPANYSFKALTDAS